MKLEKLKTFDEWMRTERGDIFNKLVEDYIGGYKKGFERDNLLIVLKDDTHYILPINSKNDIDKILVENDIKKEDVKDIRDIF